MDLKISSLAKSISKITSKIFFYINSVTIVKKRSDMNSDRTNEPTYKAERDSSWKTN